MAATPEAYIYYEYHQDAKHIEGQCGVDFEIDQEAVPYVPCLSENLTAVQAYSVNGYVPVSDDGQPQGTPRAVISVVHECDGVEMWLRTASNKGRTLNVALILTAQGKRPRAQGQKTQTDRHHFFSFFLAQARYSSFQISRKSNLIHASFGYQGLRWHDHDLPGSLDETTWQDPRGGRVQFAKLWNERKSY